MLDSLFGAEMPLAVRFFLAFLIVLGLIGATAWAVRRFGAGRLGGAGARGRQPRLGVIDYASVDGRRRLILVRRDNVEHLMMIGGPTDVVVESNIVRAQPAAARDTPAGRPAAALDTLPRAIPLPETGNGGAWPLAPESVPAARPPRVEPLPDELAARPLPAAPEAPPARPQRDTLAALADELTARPTPPPAPPRARPLPRPPAEDPELNTAAATRAEPRLEPKIDVKPEFKPEFRPERRPPSPGPGPTTAPAAPSAADTAADQSLADMAQRLEAALRKNPEARATAAEPRPPRPEPRPPRTEAEPRPRAEKTDVKSGASSQSKSPLYDNLEQEMASLLGRPNKT